MKKLFIIVLLFFILSAVCACLYVHSSLLTPLSYREPIIFEIKKGTSAQTVAEMLTEKKLAPHWLLARLAMRFYRFDTHLRAGEYLLLPNMTLKNILQKLTSGQVIMHHLTLPEGLTTAQMLKIIDKNEFLSGEITEHPGEGDLLPETYTFVKGTLKNTIIKHAKEQMQTTLIDIWQTKQADIPLQNKEELLILASLIEKETGVNAERAKVASVFYNRLKIDMPLQTDPTVIYALTNGASDLNRSLTRKDLQIESPYNTYKNKGLPPTPICNPGIKALRAAANPEDTPYFYFVADGNGGHRFAKTLAEHNQNIRLWLKK